MSLQPLEPHFSTGAATLVKGKVSTFELSMESFFLDIAMP